jgi:hypothetical protein
MTGRSARCRERARCATVVVRTAVWAFGILVCLSVVGVTRAVASDRPNVLVFVSDDQTRRTVTLR